MDVVYSVAACLGGEGLGSVAYYEVREIYRHGGLKKVVCETAMKTDIPAKFVRKVPFGFLSSRIPLRFNPFLLRENYFDAYVAATLSPCDIFHGWSSMSLFSLRKARKTSAKSVVERGSAHTLMQHKILAKEYNKRRVPLSVSRIGMAKIIKEYKECDAILVPSAFVRDSLVAYGEEEDKIFVVPYGVDLKRFRPRPEKKAEADIFRILFVGQVSLRKGVPYLLQAYDELNLQNSELILVGRAYPDVFHFLQYYLRKRKDIRWVGFHGDIENIYPAASVLVLPSLEDGFGMVVNEGMACGLPVIVSESTGAKDVVRNGKNGFIVPACDVEALKTCILYLYENLEARRRMGREARKQALRFTWKKYGDNLIRLYNCLL